MLFSIDRPCKKGALRFLFCLFLFSFSFCDAQTIDSLKIGSGGGFTGKATVFLIQNKKVYKAEGFAAPSFNQSSKLTCKQAKTIRKASLSLLKEPVIDHPSNASKWIEVFAEGKTSKYLWGDPASPPSPTVLDYYQQILHIVYTLKFN